MFNNTEQKVFEFVKKNNMLNHGDRIIAGISGGADSLCMLLFLLKLRDKLGLGIHVVHVHHGIRGESADRDALFVEEFCNGHGVAYDLVKGDVPQLARETGTTCEEAGRNFRYKTFAELALTYGCNRIAVAHNSDDNAETVLFNIFRGSGIEGVRGIRPCRSLDSFCKPEKELTIIRPVLCLSRIEIEEYLRLNNAVWCTDETNLENDYSRNKIRNSLLPMVKSEINENAAAHIGELSLQAAELSEMLELMVEEELCKCRFYLADGTEYRGTEGPREAGPAACVIEDSRLSAMHTALKKAVIRRCFGMISKSLKDVESVHINEISALGSMQTGKRADLPYGLEAVREYTGIRLQRKGFELHGSGRIALSVAARTALPGSFPKNDCIQWFDYDKLNNKAVVRTREPEDYILIGKSQAKKKLNRFMIDEKIPAAVRDSIPVLAEGSHVLWIPGYRRDDSLYITDETKTVLVAEFIKP